MDKITILDHDDFYDIEQISIGVINIVKAKYVFNEDGKSIETFIKAQSEAISNYLSEECERIKN